MHHRTAPAGLRHTWRNARSSEDMTSRHRLTVVRCHDEQCGMSCCGQVTYSHKTGYPILMKHHEHTCLTIWSLTECITWFTGSKTVNTIKGTFFAWQDIKQCFHRLPVRVCMPKPACSFSTKYKSSRRIFKRHSKFLSSPSTRLPSTRNERNCEYSIKRCVEWDNQHDLSIRFLLFSAWPDGQHCVSCLQ